LSPWTWFQRSAGITRGERLRLALEELGPIFIKFGQVLSTRRDLIPLDIADELANFKIGCLRSAAMWRSRRSKAP